MTKYLLIALFAMALALGGAGWVIYRQIGKAAEQRVKIDALQAAAKANKTLIAKRSREAVEAKKETAKLAAALDRSLFSNKEWADQPIPQEVQDALQ